MKKRLIKIFIAENDTPYLVIKFGSPEILLLFAEPDFKLVDLRIQRILENNDAVTDRQMKVRQKVEDKLLCITFLRYKLFFT